MSDAKSICDEQERLDSKRSQFNQWWQSIAERVLPAEATFTTTGEDGQKRTERLFTGKPVTDNERFAAVMDELLTPRTQQWHMLAAEDEELGEDQETDEYLERLNKLLFSTRYRPKANFAAQNHQGYLSVGAFGNQNLFIDEEVGVGPRYRHTPLRESFWSLDHVGQIECMYRRFMLTARQAELQGKELKWDLPAEIVKAIEKDPHTEFEFIHAVKPNGERKYGSAGSRGMPFASYYVALCDKERMLSSGGYRSWPYATGRYMVHGREAYGRSPAMAAWPAILTLNEEKKTILRAGQKIVDPPILLSDDGALEPFNLRSGALNPGMVSSNGTALALAFETKGNIPLGFELMGLEALDIEDAFLVSIFKILSEHPQMTATQVLEIVQQKATLLAPMMGRQQSEYLGPLIEREIDILSRQSQYAWILDEMPEGLFQSGGGYKIEYRSPLARAMRAQDGVAILRTYEASAVIGGIDSTAVHVLKGPESLRELAEINGMPAKLLRTPDEVAEIVEQQKAAEAMAGAGAIAEPLSQAAKNIAQAEDLRAA